MEPQEPRLEVLAPLGEGATARVELVRLLEPFAGLPAGAELARKTLVPALGARAEARAAFGAEAETSALARDASLVRVLHQGQREGLPYLLLQYVPGRSLREILDQDGPLPEPLLRSLGAQLAGALAALHRAGRVHGDVKPENVRLDQEGRAVLLDLGFSRAIVGAPAPHPGPGPQAGTLAYLSPERARGDKPGPAADVFALGVVLFELATGVHPFALAHLEKNQLLALLRASSSGEILRRSIETTGADELLAAIGSGRVPPPSRLAPTLSAFLDRCLLETLARAPGDRPSAQDLARRLAEGERGEWWRDSIHPEVSDSALDPVGGGSLPLVGRERELETLLRFHAARRPAAGSLSDPAPGPATGAAVAWLVGPQGSGKWRLAAAFAQRLRLGSEPPLFLDTRWDESDESRPGGALLMLLNRWLALPSGSAPTERELARLADKVGVASARALAQALDPRRPEVIDRSIPGELAGWLQALSAEREVLVLLDDLHQAGGVTLAALSTLLDALRDARVFFVLALREDTPPAEPELLGRLRARLERGSGAGGADFLRLELPPLDQAAVGQMVRLLFHDSVPLVRLAEVLWKRSHGNPGFLAEILHDLEARGELMPHSDQDSRLVLAVAPEALPRPRSLERLIRERVEALAPEERLWLERLSVVGGRIEPGFLTRAFPPSQRSDVDRMLAQLTRAGWLVSAADRYRFERPALREALYRSLSAERRRRLHLAAARGLSGEHVDDGDLELAFQRAFHLHAAGEHAELLATVRRVLGPLRRRASAQRLLTLARWGLSALERLPSQPERESVRLELLEDAADAADRLGRREDQRALLDHLAHFELDPDSHAAEGARLYLLHARYAAGTGQFALARGWLKTAVTLSERTGNRWLHSQALRRLAQIQAQVGEFEAARKLATRALAAAEGENQEALAHLALGHVAVLEDELEEALEEVGAALGALRRSSEARAGVVAYAELLHGRIWRSAGLPERALGSIQRAVRMARRSGERRLEAEALARRGGLLLDLDRAAEAQAELRDAQLLSDEIEDRRGQVLSTLWLGQLEAEETDPRAPASLERAITLAREIGFYRAESVGLALRARLAALRGDHAAALLDSQHALELCERHGAELVDRIVVTGTRALTLRLGGRAAEAERVRSRLVRRVRRGHRRLASRELAAAQEAYATRLLEAVLSDEGPVFPRR